MEASPSESQILLVEDFGAVRVLRLHRPSVRNAIDLRLRIELADAIETADADHTVHCIVLTGSRDVFCSGGDVSTMERMEEAQARPRAEAAQRVVRALWATPKPVIAAVEGAAYGAGASLALACDRIIAGAGLRLSMGFTTVGLAGDMGVFKSLPARVGTARARQMLLLPHQIDAEHALQWGLIDDLVPAGEALTAATNDAQTLAAGPLQALGAIKSMLADPRRLTPDVLELELQHQVQLFNSDDFAKRTTAFQQRRQPDAGATS